MSELLSSRNKQNIMWALAQKHISILNDPKLEQWLLKSNEEKSGRNES